MFWYTPNMQFKHNFHFYSSCSFFSIWQSNKLTLDTYHFMYSIIYFRKHPNLLFRFLPFFFFLLSVCACIILLLTIVSHFSTEGYEEKKALLNWVSSAERSALLVWSSLLSQSECLLFLISHVRLLSYSDQANTCYWVVFSAALSNY